MAATNGSNSLSHFVEELTRVEGERRALAKTREYLLQEAAAAGLHSHALLDVVKCKRQTAQQADAHRQRQDAFDNYLQQLGMLADPPPRGKAAAAARAKA